MAGSKSTTLSPKTPHVLTPLLDNNNWCNREDLQPHTFSQTFNQIGEGALEVYCDWTTETVKYIKNDKK